MTAKQKKLFLLTSMMSVFVMAVAVLFTGGKLSNPLSKVFASQEAVSMGTISFDKENSSRSGTTNTTTALTTYSSTIIAKTTNNDTTKSNGYVGAVSNGSEIHFYESDGVTEYLFEDLEKIEFSFASGSLGFNLKGFYDDGTDFSFSYSSKSTNPRSINFHDYGNVSRIYAEFTNSTSVQLTMVLITYNCNPKYQTGVEISTEPSKTSYGAGQTFDPTGMVVKTVYSNGGKVVTDHYTISPNRPLTTDDTFVTISSGGFSVTQSITVTDAAQHAVGTYKNSSYFIELYSDGTGLNYYGTDSCPLTWSFDGSALNLQSTQTYSFTGTIFHTSTSVNASSLTYKANSDIDTFRLSVKTMFGTSTVTFTRQ